MSSSPLRTVKSFVVRQGRMTPGQKAAFDRLTDQYCVAPEKLIISQLTVLEIGFGMGDALLHYAKAHPDTLYLGIEVHPPGVGRLMHLCEKDKVQNVRIIQTDAVEVLKNFIPDASLDAVHLFFPDPWPKVRHHKRRIVNPEFAGLVAKKLKPLGLFHLATDWENYAEEMLEVLSTHPNFVESSRDRGERPLTKFEQRGLKLGHQIFDFQYRKRD